MVFPVVVDMEDSVAKTQAATEPTVVEYMATVVVMEGIHPAFKIRAAEEIDSKNTMNTTRAQ